MLTSKCWLQQLQLCVERLPGVWCDAFVIDGDGVLAMTVEKDSVTCSLLASVKQLTNLQRQVPTKYDVKRARKHLAVNSRKLQHTYQGYDLESCFHSCVFTVRW